MTMDSLIMFFYNLFNMSYRGVLKLSHPWVANIWHLTRGSMVSQSLAKLNFSTIRYEDKVFMLIERKSLDRLKVLIDTATDAPSIWSVPYKSVYHCAVLTGDDDFASALINSVSLVDIDENSGWIWTFTAQKCLELNMPKSFTALCNSREICKTELNVLRGRLETYMNTYSDIINSVVVSLEHDCANNNCETFIL